MRWLTAAWQRALLVSLLLPAVASGHARLVSPPPRTTTIGKTPPCAGAARTSTPMVLTAGQVLPVDWLETVDHPGHYEMAISPANDQGFVTLLDDIPDRAFDPGATHNDYSTTLQVPATPCDACTLRLIQFMSDHPPGSQYYYSCADIRIVAATTTSTVPTVPGSPGSTTTTTLAPECGALAGYARATCLVGGATARPVCGADPLDARVGAALDTGLRKIQSLLDAAVASGTAPKRARHLVGAAGRRLVRLDHRTAAAGRRGRLGGSCADTIGRLLDELQAAIVEITA